MPRGVKFWQSDSRDGAAEGGGYGEFVGDGAAVVRWRRCDQYAAGASCRARFRQPQNGCPRYWGRARIRLLKPQLLSVCGGGAASRR